MAKAVYTRHNAADVLEDFIEDLGLCKGFRITSNLMLTKEAYEAAHDIKNYIKKIGLKKSFRLAGMQMLFTGPRGSIYKKYCASNILPSNTKGMAKYAKSKEHILLDTSHIGKANMTYKGVGIYNYIQKPFGGRKPASQPQTNFVMGFVSAAMILAHKGPSETFISGADFAKVFMMYELPALMANTGIDPVNAQPSGDLRDVYYSGDKDAVFKTFDMVSQREVELAQQRVLTTNKHKRRLARRDFNAQTAFRKEVLEEKALDDKRQNFTSTLRGIRKAKTATLAMPMPV